MKLEKIVVVKKATQLEELLRRHATTSQVKFYIESRGESYDNYKSANDDYKAGLKQTLQDIPKQMRLQVIDKEQLSTYQFGESDLIVTVGDPGLFVNVAKYVNGQPVISVNPDKKRFDSILSTCDVNRFPQVLEATLKGEYDVEKLVMAEAKLNDGQTMYALNDFFIGQKTHVSARYEIGYDKEDMENQSSSGVIVCTGTGSTAWMKSVMAGACALMDRNKNYSAVPFDREKEMLLFAVREPFESKITGINNITGNVYRDLSLKITSNMPENGVIFSDGIEEDYMDFNSGTKVTIKPAKKRVNLVRF